MSELAIASPSLPRSLVRSGGLVDHTNFLDKNGFDGGIELHPMHVVPPVFNKLSHELVGLVGGKDDVYHRSDVFLAKNLIRSAHQSYISSSEGMVPHGNGSERILAVQGLVVFFGAERSLSVIDSLQRGFRTTNTSLPVVVYPEIGREGGYSKLPFSERLFQPNIRNLRRWGVISTDDLIEKAKGDGLTGIAWDGYHYRRTAQDGLAMEDWHAVLPRLLSSSDLPIKETHISLGRNDRTENPDLMKNVMEELYVFINNPRGIGKTATGQMVKLIQEATGGKMRYVLEAPLTKKNLPSGASPKSVYKILSGNIRTFLES
jgi:hypothetical protein